jgi:lipooligosaccharide transport system permease protein
MALPAADLRALRWPAAFRFWLSSYRRTWRASLASGFLAPLLYLGSFGFGLGTLVDGGSAGRVGGVAYVLFVAPGVLAANAMQTAVGDSTYPVLGANHWARQYHAQVATPLTPTDVLLGHLAFVAFRVALGAAAFVLVGALLDAFASWWVLLALPVAVLTGLAHAGPVMAFAIGVDTDGGFALINRFVMIPLFLFAGTFFPVDQLPLGLRVLAWLTPLWHGTALSRDLALGGAGVLTSLGHLAYLLLWLVAGVLVADRRFRSQLRS